MTLAAETYGRPHSGGPTYSVSARTLGNGALWFAIFLSGFVIREPAPYELYLVFLSVVWLACGLKLRSEFGSLIICMMLYTAGGIAAIPLATNFGDAAMYIAVTGFLAVTSIFYAAILAETPERYRVIQTALIFGSLFVALAGIAGYFNLFPGADFFTRYGRARGTFEDPNVFGPFLILPILILMQGLFRRPFHMNGAAILFLPVLVLALFLSFSRGAWGAIVIASLILYVLALASERNAFKRGRLVAVGVFGLFAVIGLLGIALSIESVSDMFQQRAKLVQEYDGARLGRFARYILGFELIMDKPLGIGALEFNKYFPEDEHNVYLKGFTTYGWLGGITYLFMAVWTVVALLGVIFKNRVWAPFAQCVFAALVAHLLLSLVIDTDHWRHMYMLYGLAWGFIAADKIEVRRRQRGIMSPTA
ncbi:LpsH [Roseibium sp. TrichSKD4]|uniref:O-antigen ligase family protein n=1 Tax=Roseibium sp. TrichSKD4 TaxID=744980 RepID=UPI0001E56ECB|nr:O-antigen ligase family protein [Roseibium sp. TrichSKD4]EFO30342.1 LpsH [Roseibium sp. TrichSKD4]